MTYMIRPIRDIACPVIYVGGTEGAVCDEHADSAADSPDVASIRRHDDDLVFGVCDWCRAEYDAGVNAGRAEPEE